MPKSVIALIIICCIVTLSLLLTSHPAPQETPFNSRDVSGHLPDLQFTLTDENGKKVTAADYKGKVILVYFGFTRCPGECPTTMLRMAMILKHLGPASDRIRVLFITVDPQHDTPPILKSFLNNFDAMHEIGLTGSKEEILALAKRNQAMIGNAQPQSVSEISHIDALYVFDKSGHARLMTGNGTSDESIASDLKRLAAM
jgi:protein SCO1/2